MTFKLTEESHTRLRVKLWGYQQCDIISAALQVIDTVYIISPENRKRSTVQLPTQKRIYCILRSPHVDKDSREHFEVRQHCRFVEISYNMEEYPTLVESIMKLDLTPGVSSVVLIDPK
uniref:ribosomal protein S10 n=1 Tax=Thalassionema frauenfeldii TaxID=186022 RepID=UPI001EDED748|nr:ribosomal protein S10 [Thalassionema frauenfeldii]UHY40533.1 ribosomal protein S10 [Thalassionema frauenfeldii]UHY40921.1 ribosomal protein S10 [Thalassionema frauenfeldii]